MPDYKDRHDFRRPPGDRYGLPIVQYPTPNSEDLILVVDVPINVETYEPLVTGTPHPTTLTALLVSETIRQGNNNERQAHRVYATPRAAQDAYNARITYLDEGDAFPVFTRSYVLPREGYTKETDDQPLKSLVGLTLTAGGSGYTSNPIISFTGGGGSGAAAECELRDGRVVAVWLTIGGSTYTTAPTVVIAAAGGDASATALLTPTSIGSVVISGGVSGYDEFNPPIVTAVGGGGSGAVLEAIMIGDFFSGVSVMNGGSGYTSLPEITISYGPATGTPALAGTGVQAINVDDGGTLYSSPPTVIITGDGSGAIATASILNGAVNLVAVTSGGADYTSPPVITFSGGHPGSGATATAHIQPQTAVLTHEEASPAEGDLGSLFLRVTRVYTTLNGPVLTEFHSGKGGTLTKVTRQTVLPNTLPSTPTGVVTSDQVRQATAAEAERSTTSIVNADGTTASGFPIYTTQHTDETTGAVIFTDHFIAHSDYALPPVYVGGTQALIKASYPDWKQPNTNHIGYTNTSYNPPRYVIDARAQSVGEDSDNLLVEIDYQIKPLPRVEDKETGYTFPAIFSVNQTPYAIPADFNGRYPPPWPIGASQVGGYTLIAARPSRKMARTYITYSLGPLEASPETFSVVTPGTASKFYAGKIREGTIQTPIYVYEGEQVVEDIPSSVPAYYNSASLLVIATAERRFRGEIYEQRVTIISEDTPVSAFPDPALFFPRAVKKFRATPAVSIDAKLFGKSLYAVTSAGTVGLWFFGRTTPGDPVVSTREFVSASTTPTATTNTWIRVAEVLLDAPMATGTVYIYESVDPDYATMEFTSQPDDGDLLTIGLVIGGSPVTYTFRNDIGNGGGSVSEVLVTSPGSGYTATATVSFGGDGTGAAGTVQLTGTSVASIAVDNTGTGYGSVPNVAITGGGGSGATATAVLTAGNLTSYTITNGGTGYTSTPTVTITPTGGGGSGAIGIAVLTPTTVDHVTVTAPGAGYTTATAAISSTGGGSGATATVSLNLNTIKIGANAGQTGVNVSRAIMATGLGAYVGSGVVAHPDLTAQSDPGNKKIVHFYSKDPTTNRTGTDYVLDIFDSDGVTPETFADITEFQTGSTGQILATIPPGTPFAYKVADFSANKVLVDETNDNDRLATPSLPAAVVFYTDWMWIPGGKAIRLTYAALGAPPLRIAWQKSSTNGADPTPVVVSIAVTNGSKTIGAVGSQYIRCKILIGEDTQENEVVSTTTVLRTYNGLTGTKSASITPLVATQIANANSGKPRNIEIGIPGADYIRLKISEPVGDPGYRPMYAEASWQTSPND